MSDAQGERIQANCKIIWGDGDYDLDIESDNSSYPSHLCFVKRDYGLSFGPALTMTGVCSSSEQAWNELDRMLSLWARQKQSGQPMTRELELEIFGGPHGRDKRIVGQFLDAKEKRERST